MKSNASSALSPEMNAPTAMITYRINTPDVSAEVFEEEVLAINLKTGTYHSFREAGVPLWRLLTSGCSTESAAAALAAVSEADPAQILADARAFAEALLSHGIITPVETAPSNPVSIATPLRTGPYTAPVIEHYTDMQELLLLDPVHDVDVSGWPKEQPVQGNSKP